MTSDGDLEPRARFDYYGRQKELDGNARRLVEADLAETFHARDFIRRLTQAFKYLGEVEDAWTDLGSIKQAVVEQHKVLQAKKAEADSVDDAKAEAEKIKADAREWADRHRNDAQVEVEQVRARELEAHNAKLGRLKERIATAEQQLHETEHATKGIIQAHEQERKDLQDTISNHEQIKADHAAFVRRVS